MAYRNLKCPEFFKVIDTEEQAREWVWQTKFGKDGFKCRTCSACRYYQHHSKPEIRTCRSCLKQNRLRAGTIFEHSKLPILKWMVAVYLMMQGKRGISALELMRLLEIKCYQTAWLMLHKVRASLQERDEAYDSKLQHLIELDGATFGRRRAGNQKTVLMAIETKEWVDEKGRRKQRAGFAKTAVVDSENKVDAQAFATRYVQKGARLITDGSTSFANLKDVAVASKTMALDRKAMDRWLPWVHRLISNAKAWIIGTHHGVKADYLSRYLAEYVYRFNRRHDPDALFHRALTACVKATPKRSYVLCR